VDSGGVIPFKADWTHADEEVTALMEQIGTKQVPMLAIFSAERPNEPFVFYEAYTQASLLEKLKAAGPSKE
jgi:thiol:disulfide interchange protein